MSDKKKIEIEKPNWIERRFDFLEKKFKQLKAVWDDLGPEQQKQITEGIESAIKQGVKLMSKDKK